MIRAVIDTNCLLASIPPQSKYYWLYEFFRDNRFQWIISNEVLIEYSEKLTEIYSEKTAHLVTSILCVAPNVIFTEPYFRWQLILNDPDDNKFADLAIAGNADYIVTSDRHFNVLKELEFPRLNIVSLNEFRGIILNR
ncbi:MAG TPA: putative toxin-antitoxin system toxin component, PIN family [Mucilaginibacter sp.]|nr:putative toxin-antitoxin system toxin component, PIN family [Mucilaginibacter sp.]